MERAASLMAVRDGPKILLGLRAAGTLLDGTWAFPGGRVQPTDRDPGPAVATGGLAPEDAAARVAAVRELFEETGLLAVPGAGRVPPGRLAAHRRAVLEGHLGLPEVLRAEGLRQDLGALQPAGRWRYEGFVHPTLEIDLFVLAVPDDALAALSPLAPEVARAVWTDPADFLDAWRRGEAPATPSVLGPLEAARAWTSGAVDAAALRDLPGADGRAPPAYELVPGLRLAPVASPTIPPATHTNCYVLGAGEACVVVDPPSPWAEAQAGLDALLDGLAAQGRAVRELWLTHHHPDHVGGAAHLKRRLGVPVRAHPLTRARLAPDLVDGDLRDGETVELPGRPLQRWQVIHTPGHAPGHVCLFEAHGRSLITGDLVAGVGTVVVDPPEGDMAQYVASLRRVRALDARGLFPAHGPPTFDARGLLDRYLLHRQVREDAIASALEAGPATPRGLVARVYTDVPESLHALAERNVVAHLDKLLAEGRVRREGERFRLAPAPISGR